MRVTVDSTHSGRSDSDISIFKKLKLDNAVLLLESATPLPKTRCAGEEGGREGGGREGGREGREGSKGTFWPTRLPFDQFKHWSSGRDFFLKKVSFDLNNIFSF